MKMFPFTFPPHPVLDTLLEAAVLALVAVMLVDGTVPRTPARVRQVPPHRPLKETLAPFARELSIVLPRALVPTHDTLDALGRSGLLLVDIQLLAR